MAFTTDQVYTIVNETARQALGQDPVAAIDSQSLVSLGNSILQSNENTEAFLNILPQRIGRTIISYRAYHSKNADMVRDDFEMGAILQKLKSSMPKAIEDETYNLTDGQSVDQYTVFKGDVKQKLFVKRTPYTYPLTSVPRVLLKEAFLSPERMAAFIASRQGEVRNAIEYGMENLGRTTLNNMIAETKLEVKLLSMYNTTTGSALTADTAMRDQDFLRFAIQQIKVYSDKLTDMSVLYNTEGETRFTPYTLQRVRVLSEFQTALETSVLYAAFHDAYVSLQGYSKTNYWQAEQEPMTVQVTRASDGAETTVKNVVAVMYDHDALGMYQEDEEVLTTPVNARGRYYNTFYHLRQLWFNDLSENFILFTLN